MAEHPRPPGPAYETRDASLRGILLASVALVLLCVAAALLASGLFGSLERAEQARQRAPHPMAERGEPAPGPQLLANPARALAQYQREQRERVESYAWIDADAGVVRLPLERALELVLEEGLPSRTPASPEGDR